MRATGIVRRMDDLGRIVIPKEIRKTLRLREGDPLEIFTAKDGEVILKKYSPMGELNQFSQEYSETLGEVLGHGVIITDIDSIIATSKISKDEYNTQKGISKEIESIIENREMKVLKGEDVIPVYEGDRNTYKEQIIAPMISLSRDVIGTVIMVSKEEGALSKANEDILKIAANFLGKQVQ